HVLHYDRASDPWTSIGADGTAYAIAIAFDALDYRNAVGAATSSTGGRTWLHVRPIIEESDTGPSTPFNDKESITADPTVPGVAYAVCDPATDELYDFYNYFDGSNWFEDVIHTLGPGSGQSVEWSEPIRIGVDDDVGVHDPRNGAPLRTGGGLPSAAIDPETGRLYVAWESPRF